MQTKEENNAPTLVAIAIAAHKARDRDLEQFARGQLRERYGVKLAFAATVQREGQSDDDR